MTAESRSEYTVSVIVRSDSQGAWHETADYVFREIGTLCGHWLQSDEKLCDRDGWMSG